MCVTQFHLKDTNSYSTVNAYCPSEKLQCIIFFVDFYFYPFHNCRLPLFPCIPYSNQHATIYDEKNVSAEVLKYFQEIFKEHKSILYVYSKQIVESQYVCQVSTASRPCVLTLPEDDSSFGSNHQTRLAGQRQSVPQTCATSSGPLFHITRQGLALLNEATPTLHEMGKEGVESFPLLKQDFFPGKTTSAEGKKTFWYNLGTQVSPIGKDASGESRSTGPVNVRQ